MEGSKKKRILIIEDDHHIAEGLKLNLSLAGYRVFVSHDGVSAVQDWKSAKPDLIVLDIMLPGIDGISVLRNIRLENERIPVLILSAKGAPDDKIKGLSFGADDYLVKPFNLEEFLLRVERMLKRKSWDDENKDPEKKQLHSPLKIYRFGTNRIDFATGKALCQKGTVQLTEQEIKLIKLFIANQGKPLSRDKLLEIGWGYTKKTSTRTIDNFVARLRKYFEKNPKKPVFFKSLRSVGYMFNHDGNQSDDG
jgi:DNA-binding response OmpR family regulator